MCVDFVYRGVAKRSRVTVDCELLTMSVLCWDTFYRPTNDIVVDSSKDYLHHDDQPVLICFIHGLCGELVLNLV